MDIKMEASGGKPLYDVFAVEEPNIWGLKRGWHIADQQASPLENHGWPSRRFASAVAAWLSRRQRTRRQAQEVLDELGAVEGTGKAVKARRGEAMARLALLLRDAETPQKTLEEAFVPFLDALEAELLTSRSET